MSRPKGSKDKVKRSSRRTAWETYNYWYDKYTKGDKAGWFSPRLSKAEFDVQYNNAKLAKIPNPARSIAASQEYVDRSFERKYKEMYGHELPDLRDKTKRENLFWDFTDQLVAEGATLDEARNEFEKYFY